MSGITNDFYVTIQIWWNRDFAGTRILIDELQFTAIFTHATTAELLWHVQKL